MEPNLLMIKIRQDTKNLLQLQLVKTAWHYNTSYGYYKRKKLLRLVVILLLGQSSIPESANLGSDIRGEIPSIYKQYQQK